MFRTENEPLVLLIELTPRLAKRRFRQCIYEAWDHNCAYCGDHATSLDHIVPKFKSGSSAWFNLVPACLSCNGHKGSEDMETWYRKQDFFCEKNYELIIAWTKGDKIEFIADDSYYQIGLGVA